MTRELRRDLERYQTRWYRLALNPAIWALVWYRLGHWLHKEPHSKIFSVFKVPYGLVYTFIEAFMQMRLDPSAQIGPGLYIGHSGGVHIHPDVVIGENCNIAHHVTIGTAGVGRTGVPRLGNSVYVGTGATLIGPIEVGDGARIAANTLVMTSIPAGASVIGVPGRVIPQTSTAKSD